MVKFYEGNEEFKFNWDQVAKAFWCRYPNPYSKHVLTEDVVRRHVDLSGNLCTKRLICKTNGAPKWGERFLPAKQVFIIEESILDPKRKLLTSYTRNIDMKTFMTIEEKVTYKPNSENPNWTIAERQAWVNSNFGYGLSRAVQAFGFERFKKNVVKACKGFEFVLTAMYNHIDPSEHTFEHFNQLNPVLREKLKEKLERANKKASELAAFGGKQVPFVAVSANEQ